MFDSGGSSGQLRDELGVLPPGDVLKCALALSPNENEARRVLLARLPMLREQKKLQGHTGGNLLLSRMEQYSGDFLVAVDALRTLLGCQGHVWPVSLDKSSICAEYESGQQTRGEVEVDAAQLEGGRVTRLWLEPDASIHPAVAAEIRKFDAVVIGPGSFYTSIMPPLLVRGVADALAEVKGPVVLIANLLTEGRGMDGFTAGDAVRLVSATIGRRVDAVMVNTGRPPESVLARYTVEHKAMLPLGEVPADCEIIEADFWQREIARHDRWRLAYAVWSVLAKRLL
jgi:uncharacterized cofD-like protein